MVKTVNRPADAIALYARVSSSEQRSEEEAQLRRLVLYAHTQGLNIAQAVSQVGSGLNGHRPKLLKLLSDPNIQAIVVEHRDRLIRFGAEYVEAALAAQ